MAEWMAEWLALQILDHEIPGRNSAGDRIQLVTEFSYFSTKTYIVGTP